MTSERRNTVVRSARAVLLGTCTLAVALMGTPARAKTTPLTHFFSTVPDTTEHHKWESASGDACEMAAESAAADQNESPLKVAMATFERDWQAVETGRMLPTGLSSSAGQRDSGVWPPLGWSYSQGASAGWGFTSPNDMWSRAWPTEPSTAENPRTEVVMLRYGSERNRVVLMDEWGRIPADAMDQVSVMLRPPRVARPSLPLPDEPDVTARPGEWVESVRMVHPALVEVFLRIARAFPGRSLYIVSGYRPGSGTSRHATGRAVDLHVQGVENEQLYGLCKQLDGVGCGYYPNHNFVHLDVRPHTGGAATWVDVSGPGEPSVMMSETRYRALISEEQGIARL
jgi:Bacterial protein of unknown function (DUF882)